MFVIVFVETGLVVMPFLPGDSLMFVVGALAGAGLLNYPLVMALLVAAAVIGDQTNYSIGRHLGPKVFRCPALLSTGGVEHWRQRPRCTGTVCNGRKPSAHKLCLQGGGHTEAEGPGAMSLFPKYRTYPVHADAATQEGFAVA